MARRRLFDDKGETIKMKRVEEKKPTGGRERFFDEGGKSEFEKAQEKVEKTKKSVDPFKGQTIRKAEPEKKKSWFKKVSEKLAPYFLDVPDVLKKPKDESVKENIKFLEDDRQSYLRQKRTQKTFKEEGVTAEHIINPEKFIPKDYKEPEGFYGSVKEGIIAGYYSSIKPAIGSVIESLGHDIKSPEMIQWGEQYADKQVAYVLKHPELLRPTDLGGAFEGGLGDKRWYGRTIGETVPFVTTIIGVSTATALTTKNPFLVKSAAFSSIAAIEKGNAYRGMIEKGIAPDKAAPASTVYGTIAAVIENSFGFKPAEIAMNATGKNIVKNSYKNFLMNELPKYSKEFLGKVVVEGGEESAQQFSENLVTKWLDSTQGLWEGVAESFPAGVIGALPFGGAEILSRIPISPAREMPLSDELKKIKEEVGETSALERQKEIDVAIEEKKKPKIDFVEKQEKARDVARDKLRVETLEGKRENLRLDNDLFIKKLEDLFPKGATSETEISVYRASATEIKEGDQVTTNKANVEKYLKIREGSELQEIKVKLKDLVRNEGLRNEFVYAPKEERIVKIPETSEKTKPQEAITEVKKEILTKEEIADMRELKKKKDDRDKIVAEIEKDEVRVKTAKELAKKIKKEEIKPKFKVGDVVSGVGKIEEVIIQKDRLIQYRFGAGDWRAENVVENLKKKEIEKEKPKKEIRIMKPSKATPDGIVKELAEREMEIRDYLVDGKKVKYKRPLIGKAELKTLFKSSEEFKRRPILTVSVEKNLEFKGKKMSFMIKPEALQLKKENLIIGEEILIDEKALKEKGAQMQMRIPAGKGGALGASVGTFADGTPIKTGSLKEILPIQFPDLIHLARQIGSSVEINRRLKTSRGRFSGAFGIQLHKDLFSNTEQATKTLAHEIGHLIDWIPDKAMDRGNILGRLFSLRNFLKQTYGEHQIKNEEYKKELWELSKYWRPMPEIVSDNFLKYRKSPSELYADAISVLLNSPGLLEEKAPNFYKSFFENLDRKPVVFEEFFSLQEELRMGSNELTKKWRERVGGTKGMYEKANYKAIEIQKHKEDEIKKERSIGQLWAQTKRGIFSLHSDYETKVKEIKKKGGTVNDNENPVYYLNERNYVGSKIKSVVEKHLLPAIKEIKKNGITQEELGEILFYERILKGDRGEVANPGGFQKEFVEEMMGESVDPKTREIKQNEGSLKKELGEEKFAILKKQAKVFRSGLKNIFEMGYREGIYNDELYKLMQENEYYVPFKTQKYMDQKTKASVSKKVGTLSDIENPINTSIEKAMAIVRTVENNKAKRAGILFLQKEFLEDIEKAKTRFVNDRLEIIDVRDKTVFYMKGGKPVGFYVPKYVADSLNNRTTEEIKVITHTLGRVNRKWFKPVFVGINIGFHIANFARDFFRFWKNIPKMSFAKAFKLYYQAYPHARKKAKVEEDVLVAEMEEEGILGLTLNDYMAGGTEEDIQNDIIMSKIGLAQEKKSFFEGRKILSPIAFILDKIKEMGDTIEALPKIAGYIHFKGDEAGPKISMGEKDFIRRYVGSPDFFAKGSWTKNTNDIFLFSNAIIQGVRSDIEIATNPETRSEFWWKTSKVVFIPKMLMAAATMGMFGELLKEIMDEATEYDKTNYIIIPIGKDENKKAVYFRLPQDETSRFFGSIFWKGQRFLTSGDIESMQDIIGLWGGQLPAITPAIALPGDLFQFATGKNVYDTYRQRTVLTEDQAIAGWKYKAKPVATYVWNQAGGNIFLKLYSGEPTEPLSAKENFLRLPIVSNVIGRFFKVTDYGKVEILRKDVTDPIRKEVAEKRMEDKKLINEYVKKVRESSGFFERRKLERELAETIIGHKPKGSEEISESKRIIKKLDIAIIKGQSDDVVNSLIYARTNKEKTELLNGYKESMSETEFSNLRTLLLKHKIVSRDVFNKLNK